MTLKLTSDNKDVPALLKGVSTKPEITSLSFIGIKFYQNEAAALFSLMRINRRWDHVVFENCDGHDDEEATDDQHSRHYLDIPIATFMFNDNVQKMSFIGQDCFNKQTSVAMNATLNYTKSLQRLRIVEAILTKSNIKPLANALASENCNLKELEISSCRFHSRLREDIGNDDDELDVVQLLEMGLQGNQSVENLSLKNCNLSDNDVSTLLEALLLNTHQNRKSIIKELDLGYNQCCTKTLTTLSRLLQSSTCQVEKLNLEHQQQQEKVSILDRGTSATAIATRVSIFDIKPIVGAFLNNTTLKYIDMSGNNLNDDDIILLAASLSENSKLETLHLWDNQLSDEGATTLAKQILPKLHGLKRLYLGENPFGKTGSQHVLESLEVNDSIQHVQLPAFTWVREMAV